MNRVYRQDAVGPTLRGGFNGVSGITVPIVLVKAEGKVVRFERL